MSLPYFIFNNISSKDMGVVVNKLPSIIKVNREMNKINVPGRDGFLTEDLETYSGMVKSCECTLLDIANVDEILMWLDGSGDVVFSNQPDRKYKASIMNQIPFEKIIEQYHKFIVIFDCQPFAKAINNDDIILTSPGTIYNSGTYKSKPIITVHGSGSIDLGVNSNIIGLTNVVDYVTVDSELVDCYKGTALKNSNMTGEFPELLVGENIIGWTGTVTSVVITPNWRYR